MNFRKEFFRVDFETLRNIVEENHGEVEYVAEPEALEYHNSLNLKDEDFEFMEKTVQSVLGANGVGASDD